MHFNKGLADKIHELTSQDAFDIIQVEFSFMTPYLAFINPRSRAKTVLSMHNVESVRFARELEFAHGVRYLALLIDHHLFRSWEENSLLQFDGILAVSPSEMAWIKKHAPAATVRLAPNGVDCNFFSVADEPRTSHSIVFTALMNYPPNIDAALWFCNEILPIIHSRNPEVTFTIVGDKPDPAVLALRKRKGVFVTGRVPDIRYFLSDARALVVPVRSGGGTRLKILEAMAMGRPVVSTSQGAEGLEVTDGLNILLADKPEDFAQKIFTLFANPELAKRLCVEGRKLVEQKYDWSACLGNIDDFYQTLLNSSPPSPRSSEIHADKRLVGRPM